MAAERLRWVRVRQKKGPFDRENRPTLEGSCGWKIVVWWKSSVVEIHDRRYRWTLRFCGVGDPRGFLPGIGQLTHGEAVMALRKIERVAGGGAQDASGSPADAKCFPNLWEHLSVSRYPDGSVRELSSLVVVGGGSEWRGCLSDRDNGRVCWKTGETLEELLLRLEEAAAAEEPRDWRVSAPKEKSKKR